MPKVKRWAGNLLLILISLVLGVAIVEICLRLINIEYPILYKIDEYTGLANRPRASGWLRKEGEAYIRINSDGWRDREHSKAKPANTLRIAVLGDSYAEASQVAMEETFWSVMERELSGCKKLAGRQVEVLNFGINGHGTAQELMTLRHRVWDYSPDMVVLAFLTGNDIVNNSRTLERDEMRPYFIYRDGKLVLDDSFLTSNSYRRRQSWQWQLQYKMISQMRVLQVLNKAKDIISQHQVLARQKKNTSSDAFSEPGIDNAVYKAPSEPAWQEAWSVTEGIIKLMRDEIEEKGANFLVVTLSNGMQVHTNQSTRKKFMQQLGVQDLFYPDLRIKALGDRAGFRVLNLAQSFQAYAEKNQVCLHGFKNTNPCEGHWNAEGHRLAGEKIAQKLCADFSNSSL